MESSALTMPNAQGDKKFTENSNAKQNKRVLTSEQDSTQLSFQLVKGINKKLKKMLEGSTRN